MPESTVFFPGYLTVTALAKQKGVTRQAIHRACKEGRLRFVSTPLGMLIPEGDASRYEPVKPKEKP